VKTFETKNDVKLSKPNSKKDSNYSQDGKTNRLNLSKLSDNYFNIKKEPKKENFVQKTEMDDDDDDLLMNCDLISIESKNTSVSTSKKVSNQNFMSNDFPIKRPPSTEVLSSICSNSSSKTNSSNNNNNNKKKMKIDFEPDYEDAKENFEPKPQNKNKGVELHSLSKKPETNKAPLMVINDDEDDDFLNFIASKTTSKPAQLKDLSDQEFLKKCCWSNRPSNKNLSTCSHDIKCSVKTFTGALKQANLNWMQDLVVTNDSGDELSAYIGNDPLADLLQLTCQQAKELFKKFKESGKSQENDENFLLFERKRNEGQEKLRRLNSTMHFKFDFEKQKFCIYKIDK
jgi:hypothetical protein